MIPDVEHFQHRLLQDAINEATSRYWLRRADQFDAARPRVGDFHGDLTRDDLNAKWVELTEIAKACRARASVSRWQDLDPEAADILRGVA